MSESVFERRPRSLSSTYLVIMLVGLLLIQAVFFFITIRLRTNDQLMVALGDRARVASTAYEMFAPLPPEDRLALAERLHYEAFRIAIADGEPFSPDNSYVSESFKSRIRRFVANNHLRAGDFVQPEVLARVSDFSMNWGPFPRSARDYISTFMADAAISLDHGQWLHLEYWEIHRLDQRLLGLFLEMFAQFLLNLALAVFVINHVTKALRQMAAYADQLVPELPVRPALTLPTRGPSEVLRTSRAIEAMYRRIRGFVNGRFHMLASISHDLRTPIHRIRLFLEKDPRSLYQAQLMEALDDLQSMADDAVSLARAGVNHEEERLVELSGFLRSVVEDRMEYLQLAEQDGLSRQILLRAENKVVCRIRPRTFRRCLDNILDNALNYGDQVEVGLKLFEETLEIRIEDNGPGIPEAMLDKVFLPFFRNGAQERAGKKGSGLGLSIAQDMASLNRAALHCENRPQGGLRVTILMPKSAEQAEVRQGTMEQNHKK